MKERDLISIIMPAYNCEKYIAAAVQSVIEQTYDNWELIIVNDCSTDNTPNIIKDFQRKDSRIKIYENAQNLGVSATRNRCISEASGEWVAFLDSDDMWDARKLDLQIKYAQKNTAGFIFTGASYIDENGEKYKGIFEIPEKAAYKDLLKQNVISCSSAMAKREYFDDVKMENDDIHEDFCVWLRILRSVDFAHGINEPLLIYRITRASKSGNKMKSARMTYKTYRYAGLGRVKSWYYMTFYIARSLKKYRKILR